MKSKPTKVDELKEQKKTRPTGDEAKGYPDNGRNRTDAVLEKGLPPGQQRVSRSGK